MVIVAEIGFDIRGKSFSFAAVSADIVIAVTAMPVRVCFCIVAVFTAVSNS
jgi:hypothetical protein